MRALGNILWYFPFFGFVSAGVTWVIGLLLTVSIIAAPIGLGLMEYGKYLLAPFSNEMVSKSELNIEQNQAWKTYSTIVMILYLPIGAIMAIAAVIQTGLLFLTIIGIPMALVVAKSIGTYFNPVNKKCVHRAVKLELEKRKAQAAIDKNLGTD